MDCSGSVYSAPLGSGPRTIQSWKKENNFLRPVPDFKVGKSILKDRKDVKSEYGMHSHDGSSMYAGNRFNLAEAQFKPFSKKVDDWILRGVSGRMETCKLCLLFWSAMPRLSNLSMDIKRGATARNFDYKSIKHDNCERISRDIGVWTLMLETKSEGVAI